MTADQISLISAITSILMVAISLGAAVFIGLQIRLTKRATEAQTYALVLNTAQKEDVREARRLVFEVLKHKAVEEWDAKEVLAGEIVCHTYDTIGQMVRNKYLPKELIIKNWGPSLRETWPVLQPLVEKYRQRINAPEIWDDYEWLAREAEIFKQQREQQNEQKVF